MVEQHMTKEMMGVYRDINSHLIARQIMPTIRPTFRKAQNSSPRKSGTSNGAANSNAAEQARIKLHVIPESPPTLVFNSIHYADSRIRLV